MKFKELFLKYGIASLFGVTRYLHSEVERLQLRVWQLENRDISQYTPSGYEDLDGEDNLDDGWFDAVTEVGSNGAKGVTSRDEIFGQRVKPRNIRRTVDDLMREAKTRHDAEYEKRAMVDALKQEEALEEMIEQSIPKDDETKVIVSEAKKNFLIEAGRAVIQNKSE